MVGICKNGQEFYFDKEDYAKIQPFCWHTYKSTYIAAYNPETKQHMQLHRYVMDCPNGYEVDHINHVGYDNRKQNLRICKQNENALNKLTPSHNTSGHKNVCKSKGNKWSVRIRRKWIGTFDSYEEACAIEEEKEKELYGEFSVYSNLEIK